MTVIARESFGGAMETKQLRVAVFSSTSFGWQCIRDGIFRVPEVDLVGILTTAAEIPISYASEGITISTHADFDSLIAPRTCEIVRLTTAPRTNDYLQPLRRWRPDLILALGWYYIVPRAVRESVPGGCLGIHASLLPKYRGGAPLVWAIINGETQTGVSLFELTDEVDAGDILGQSAFEIANRDTIAEVMKKAAEHAAALLRSQLPQLARGQAERTPQDHAQATLFPQRCPADGLIDWSWPPNVIYNFVRAQTRPYPGAFYFEGDQRVYVWDPEAAREDHRQHALRTVA